MSSVLKNNRLLKKTLYVILTLIGVYLLLLVAAGIYINSNKNKLVAAVNEKIKNSIRGNVQVQKADIALWRFFPKFAVVLENVVITDSLNNSPFLKMQEVALRFGLLDVIGKTTTISSVKCINGSVFLLTDTTGYTNRYVITSSNKERKTDKQINIQNIELQNVSLTIEERRKNKRFDVLLNKADADIKKTDSGYIVQLEENCTIKQLGFNLAKGSYLKTQIVEAKWLLHYNTPDATLSFDDTKVNINDQLFHLKGNFWLKDSAHFRLEATSKKFSWQQAMAMVPENIHDKLNNFKLSKPLDLHITVAGPMAYRTIPEVNMNWVTANNQIVTSVTTLDSCSFKGSFTNAKVKGLPLTDDNSEISIINFTGKWGDIPLQGEKAIITNLKEPVLQFNFSSQCSFAQLNEQLALRTIHFISGNAQLFLKYNGLLSADPALLNKLTIDLTMQNGTVEYVPRNMLFTGCNGEILFSGNILQTNNLQCSFKQNHFNINIAGNDLNRFSDSVAGKGNIVCSVSAPAINLSDFTSMFAPAKKSAQQKKSKSKLTGATSQIDNILENGTVQLNLNTGSVHLNKFDAQNVRAQLLFQANSWRIQQASLQHANGSMNVSAVISETGAAYESAKLNARISNMDIKKLFYAFNNFGQTGIESQNLKGTINSTADITLQMSNKGAVIPRTIAGTVDFSIKNGALINYAPLQNIKTFVLKDRDLSNIEFAELHDKLEIRNNDIQINRMEIESSVISVFVEGVYSLKGNTDISLQVPLKNLKKRKEGDDPKNAGIDAKMGPSVYLRVRPDKNGQLKVGLDVFKKLRKEDKDALEKGKQ